MVFAILFNYFLNQLIGRFMPADRPSNNNNNNHPGTHTEGYGLSDQVGNIFGNLGNLGSLGNLGNLGNLGDMLNVDNLTQLPNQLIGKLPSINGMFSMYNEFLNLLLRVDKRYANSRKYAIVGNTRYEGKVAVITGGDKDIGAETAIELARNGYKVIVGAKNFHVFESEDTEMVSKIRVLRLDLSSLESVRDFAKEVSKGETKIDLLINGSNVFENSKVMTKDGYERNFEENYLGHFLLTNLLLDQLKKSDNGRIVNVSSIMHYFGALNFNDINSTKGTYISATAYAQAMLAQVLFTRELSKRLIDTNITVYAVSPEIIRQKFHVPFNTVLDQWAAKLSNPVNGAQTLLYVALDDNLKNESGFYYTNLHKVHPLMCNGTDDTSAERLWALSETWVQLEDEHKIKPPTIEQHHVVSTRVIPVPIIVN